MLRFLQWLQRHELAVFVSLWALYSALGLAVGTRLFPPSAIHDFNLGVFIVLATFTFALVVDLSTELVMHFVSQLITAHRLRASLQETVPDPRGPTTTPEESQLETAPAPTARPVRRRRQSRKTAE